MKKKMDINRIIREAIDHVLLQEANQDVIEPTTAWMKRKYDEFNASIFNNELPQCALAVGSLPENVLGRFTRSKTALSNTLLSLGAPKIIIDGEYITLNKQTYYRFMKPKITISNKYARSEQELENTLIHEMCHYYTCFDEEGNARAIDRDNNGHGQDFEAACQLVAQNTNGMVTITQVASSEKMDSMQATSQFNKSGVTMFKFEKNGQELFFFLKDLSLADDYKKIFKWNLQATTNPTLLMLLKRYRYQMTTARTFMSRTLVNAYAIDQAPSVIQDAFNESEWTTY